MNAIYASAFVLFAIQFQALSAEAADSLAIFHNPNRVVVVVNEKGGAKLGQVLAAIASNATEANWEAPNKDVTIGCKRTFTPYPQDDPYSCTFRFTASGEVTVGAQNMIANIGTENEHSALYFDLSFVNAQNASFSIKMTSSSLNAETHKP